MKDKIQEIFKSHLNLSILSIEKDNESEEYWGYNYLMNDLKFKFRKSKITPKKIGQFVTLWKRNNNGITEPFHVEDDFDFYIIYSLSGNKEGMFIFSKQELAKQHIITDKSEGKRGFRVYPEWDVPPNKQAVKSKDWQSKYFINISNHSTNTLDKYLAITSQ